MSVPLDPETEKTVDSIIDRLLSVRGNKPGKATQVGPQSYEVSRLFSVLLWFSPFSLVFWSLFETKEYDMEV